MFTKIVPREMQHPSIAKIKTIQERRVLKRVRIGVFDDQKSLGIIKGVEQKGVKKTDIIGMADKLAALIQVDPDLVIARNEDRRMNLSRNISKKLDNGRNARRSLSHIASIPNRRPCAKKNNSRLEST